MEKPDPQTTTDPRTAAVRKHFSEWHGVAPDDIEIEALLSAIDASDLLGIENAMCAMEHADGR